MTTNNPTKLDRLEIVELLQKLRDSIQVHDYHTYREAQAARMAVSAAIDIIMGMK